MGVGVSIFMNAHDRSVNESGSRSKPTPCRKTVEPGEKEGGSQNTGEEEMILSLTNTKTVCMLESKFRRVSEDIIMT